MNYHNISYPDMLNGDGLRVVLWLSGCSHHCYNCQNPQTWDDKSGIPFDKSAKEELYRELAKDYISGLTLSGGDPLYENNLDDVLYLIDEIRLLFPEKTIWIYTGYEWEYIFNDMFRDKYDHNPQTEEKILNGRLKIQDIIKQCDVLVDGRYIDSKKDVSLPWRGSSNQRVINVKKSLEQNEVVLLTN